MNLRTVQSRVQSAALDSDGNKRHEVILEYPGMLDAILQTLNKIRGNYTETDLAIKCYVKFIILVLQSY